MKKVLALIMTLTLFLSHIGPVATAETDAKPAAPQTEAESCILIDAATGNVLYEKNPDKKQYPASTTKVMTAALAIDMGYTEVTTTVSKNAVKSIGINGSKVGLKAGETLSMRDLVNMALISSANDAANAIAEGVSGTINVFVNQMNAKARQLGLKNTIFSNPIGLDVGDKFPNQKTSARDLALIMRYATSLPAFRETIGKSHYVFPVTNLHTYSRNFSSTNHLLTDSQFATDSYRVIGGKTGWTQAAQNVFVASARNRDGKELIIVLMKHPSREGMFRDAKKFLDYGFDLVSKDETLAKTDFYDIRLRSSVAVIEDFYQKGYVSSSQDGRFNYTEQVIRKSFLKVLDYVRGKASEADDAVACFDNALADGLIDASWYDAQDRIITRGEVIAMMDQLLDIKLEDSEIPVFKSLIKDFDKIPNYLQPSVLRVYKSGIMKGNGDGTIQVERGLSKEEMVLILNNFMQYQKKDASLVRIVLGGFSCSKDQERHITLDLAA